MKRKRTYKIPHRRVREGKTDYRKRFRLLKGGKPRLVIRSSSNSVTCQIVEHSQKGDRTLVSVNNSSLRKLGWKAHGGNIPAAYITGLICGTYAKKKGITEAVADTGLQTSTKGSRIYAAVKGVVDSGMEVPHSPEVLPPEDRISGKHISSYANSLKKDDQEKYKRIFSAYLKANLHPEDMEKHFEEVKGKVK